MHIVITAFVLLVCVANVSIAQPIPRSIRVITDLVEKWTDDNIGIAGAADNGDTLVLDVLSHPDADWVRSIISERATTAHGRVVRSEARSVQGDVRPRLEVGIVDLSTRYQNIEATDSILRVITVDIKVRRVDGVTTDRVIAPLSNQIRCTRASALEAESSQHNASHGTLPPMPHSFWDDVLEPVVFIAAAAVTVILLFTIRSQ